MIFCWHTSLAIAKRSVGIAYLVNTLLYNQAAQQLSLCPNLDGYIQQALY
ncbi:hypothetical protein H6G25_03225 [Dolichospermum sp. FACHB-1091]|nr:hypothetical protein [Dolichospermum sp. FACHB-1091]MBD2442232.1 hypothetical protein [Dolichospermum sp. FACHB-1091]